MGFRFKLTLIIGKPAKIVTVIAIILDDEKEAGAAATHSSKDECDDDVTAAEMDDFETLFAQVIISLSTFTFIVTVCYFIEIKWQVWYTFKLYIQTIKYHSVANIRETNLKLFLCTIYCTMRAIEINHFVESNLSSF